MKIEADWITSKASQEVCDLLSTNGYQVFFVGGCVRNALMDVPVSDLDISTDARPDQVMELARAAGLKAIPTGIDHGTVTVMSDGEPYEITTFRKDVSTDGRRAEVRFSDDIAHDAVRRDFTMNALYADPGGNVADPLGGLPDLEARRIRFIQDPERRIQEDYLRILRFFRFHAWYGDPDGGLDAEGLAAIAANVNGLGGISKERIGAEMLKLLSAPDPAPSVAAMQITGTLQAVLHGAQSESLPILVKLEEDCRISPDPIRRLACLGGEDASDHLRLSKSQARDVILLSQISREALSLPELGYKYGQQMGTNAVLVKSALMQQQVTESHLYQISQAATQVFPISAADLMPDYTGPALGRKLRELEAAWIMSGFALTKTDLLARE
ncbi:CCA-adding enzyme [Roseovarius albus]|uniref:CCA-adding enzyme n=2 Tax=Roseovarius albus TaxID=1247867 RepID=A0A1X6Z614_9RHOB|nr:CCA-adding enzyme [Roseovarius albus]